MTAYILASQSPRRRELLRNLINQFIVVETDIEEVIFPGEKPAEYVLRVAKEKALAAGKRMGESSLQDVVVIAADTIVVDQDQILGKPKDPVDAKNILERLKGKSHQVLSGMAVYQFSSKVIQSRMVFTEVRMREYSEIEIQEYIASGDPFDKAGAYAIQNDSFNPAPNIKGCYANVMGLPLCHLSLMLREADLEMNFDVADRCQASIKYSCPVYTSILNEETVQ